MTALELIEKIHNSQNELTDVQKKIANYVTANYKQIPFLSITALANNIGVSENSLVKFSNFFGFEKFSGFKATFAEYAVSELVITKKLSGIEKKSKSSDYFTDEISEGTKLLAETLSHHKNQQNLPKLVDLVNKAKRIYCIGGRMSGRMASILSVEFRYLGLNVVDIQADNELIDRCAEINQEDLVIAFSFPRYTKDVVEMIKKLHARKVKVVLITDMGLSPAEPYSDLAFRCSISGDSFVQSYTACISLMNVICRAVASTRKKQQAEHLAELEQALLSQNVYYKE